MPNRVAFTKSSPLDTKPFAGVNPSCTDPIVGAILSGWRYDISSISPEMRTDYENHLGECTQCRDRQSKARRFDVLLISVSSLSIVAFVLAAILVRRMEMLNLIARTMVLHLHTTPIVISLEAVAITGAVISTVLWVLVAISTPVPGLVSTMVEARIPSDIRQRFARRHA